MDILLNILGSILVLLALFIYVGIWTSIVKKTGRAAWVGMVMLIPGVNLVYLVVLAVTEWPIEAELKKCRQELEDLRSAANSTSE
ncbi:hypothetical protein [Actomonas aquatica]|uniref:DUF4282 domain-containing protein n=1 Tax=Actomonas aquatica TaxID=2866162 RepID=A0ABZ1C1P3_9BACT|nr:hypothetical protein [Opitutus sp. WL0086]WRQ85526.1 hypothetical protein K1X11_012005 [Opitutus sp. WL0086]